MKSMEDIHKEKFPRIVRNLLIKAGFGKEEINIQPPTEEGPDIIVNHTTEDRSKIKLIIQCKQAEERGEKFENLNNLIRTYSSYVREYKANIAILILAGYDLPPKFEERKKIEDIKRKEKVVYWGDRAWRYYKTTIENMGSPYARYLILRDLGFRITLQPKPYEVEAIQIHQHPKGTKLWMFSMEPSKLLNIAYVFRRGLDPEAYQRMLEPKRLSKIAKFLSSKESLLANNIIIAFDTNVKFKKGKLLIPAKTCSAWVVDGQHRLYGFCKIEGKDKKKILRYFKLPVIGIKENSEVQARLFTTINSKQKQVNRNLLLDLCDLLELDPERGILERIRIVKKLAKEETFKGKIKILPKIDEGEISLATFVDYPKFKKLVNTLRRPYPVFSDFFRAVREVFPEWDNKEFVFSTAKGVRMLISLLVRIVDYCDRKNEELNYGIMKSCLQNLKDACENETDYFKRSNYTGKALGAGAPDKVALELWAARIDDKLGDFLSEGEKQQIGREARETLARLEEELRKCIENRLRSLTPNWWVERVPPDVRDRAEERKRRDEKDNPPHYYIDFSDYKKIITRRDNWEHAFKPIFKKKEEILVKLDELEPIRNSIAHNRKLTGEDFERLKMYTNDLISSIRKFESRE